MKTVLGVDACKNGWVGIAWSAGKITPHFAPTISELAKLAGPVAVIAVDMPIGLPERGFRQADLAARKFLGTRRSSVFMTPVRAALAHQTHPEASEENRKHTGKGMSIQAFSLLTNIRQVDEWRRTVPCPVVEVHPEVSFAQLADFPLARKKTWAGANQRAALLTAEGFDLCDAFGEAGRRAAVDDILDAAVVAWTARRVLDGTAIPLPAQPEPLSDGTKAAIWR